MGEHGELIMGALAFPERITMTLEEFLALPEQDEHGNHFELDEGELVVLSPVGAPHARRVTAISAYLFDNLDSNTYDVLTGEAGILMAYNPRPVVRGMDVAVLYKQDTPGSGMVRTPPLLIVEVVSPGNNPVDLERKRRQYQKFGVQEIWFVYEETQSIHLYGAQATSIDVYERPQSFHSVALDRIVDTTVLFR